MLAATLLLSLVGVLGWRTGVFGEVLTTLAVLACPVSMGLMMWQMSRHSNTCATPTLTMTAFSRWLGEFQARFADELACAAYLAASRWPQLAPYQPRGHHSF